MADENDWSCEEDIIPDGRLPGDLMVSILTNLPVKSLLKFKSVSKPWCSLISSRRFTKLHLRRQSVIANKLLLSYCSQPLTVSEKNDFSNFRFAVLDHDLVILASCSGLVCLAIAPWFDPDIHGLLLWNPATRKFRPLDDPIYRNNIGMGYVEATDDYKIVVWSDTQTSIYSLNSDSWKELYNDAQQFPIGRYQKYNPAFINGRIHWLTYTCTCCNARNKCVNEVILIVVFDVADEVVSFLGVPDNRPPTPDILCPIDTLVIKGCLSVMIFSREAMEIWMMEEYGVEGSWVKQFTIQGLPRPMANVISWNDCEIVYIKDYNAHSFLEMYGCIMFCVPVNKQDYYLKLEPLSDLQVFNYVESLASVGKEEGTFKMVGV